MSPPVPEDLPWQGRFELMLGGAALMGDARVRLLEAIDGEGSISKAAPRVPLSYKAAWDAVEAMNNLSARPLVERVTGGRHGGGAVLTAHGRRMVGLYRNMESECQQAMARLMAKASAASPQDAQDFSGFLRQMAWRTSARNQFMCVVVGIDHDEVDVRLRLRLDDSHLMEVCVTHGSADRLGIELGMSLMVLIKASAVSLSRSPSRGSARSNQLWGAVSEVIGGEARSEISLRLDGGRSITAVLSRAAVARLKPVVGERLCARFDPSSPLISI